MKRTFRIINAVGRRLTRRLRWLRYSLTIFIGARLPWSTVFLGRLRVSHLPLNLKLGRNCHFGDDVFLGTADAADIILGDAVSVNNGTHIVAYERISIGKNTAIAEYVSIRDQLHKMKKGVGPRNGEFDCKPIEIGENCWIGRGVFIGAGASIGDNCVIGANSVVHGSFPDNVLIAGAPARIKKQIELQ